jgi:signal transduction histidine kinase
MAAVFMLDRLQRRRLLKQAYDKAKDRELAQAKEIEKAYTELKSTQAQLIQSEKLASLGELTAGIAHEIQNPLNFVNNFSELNRELITEMKEEIEKGNFGEVKTIAEDLETNEERINHHGQRASSIVKGMLEHSRASTGVKEPTDLNALADEYLRLAYHGLRAKDSSFNAKMETHFDPDLPKVSVISQDIGRVLLNLINNAFYAVTEKAKQGIEGYQPTVTISSRKLENAVEIRVEDNGNGIPAAIKDKIFQPFFTTKPTGQGTGLGLSLAYDIVTKGHGGSMQFETSLETGTTFILTLTNPRP